MLRGNRSEAKRRDAYVVFGACGSVSGCFFWRLRVVLSSSTSVLSEFQTLSD